MRLRAALIAVISTAAISVPGLTDPASAADPPVIASPANGGSYRYGSAGIRIDVTTADSYLITANCVKDGTTTLAGESQLYLDAGRNDIYLYDDQLPDQTIVGSTCTFGVRLNRTDTPVTSTFIVVENPFQFTDLRFAKKTFYPLVEDDYLDEAEILVNVTRPADYTVSITDTRGKVVDHATGQLGPNRDWLTWDGTTTSGKPVPPGTYRVSLTATSGGVTSTKTASVRVATKMATRRWTLDLYDDSGSNADTRGKCIHRLGSEAEGYNDILDCRGGKFAAITYTFKIPANARRVRSKVKTIRTEDDFPGRGTISHRGERVSKTRYRVRIQVTGYRAVAVEDVLVSYTARVRI